MNELELLKPTQIIRSKRKSISLIVKSNGDFIIRAPLKCKEVDISNFVNQKSQWIISKRREQLINTFKPLSFNGNEELTLLGQKYDIIYSNVSRVEVINNKINVPETKSKEKLIVFLKKLAKQHIFERTKILADTFDFNYNSISISSAKSCWGSCGPKNRLHFTYKLILCPESVVDYVIIHELAHTKVKNHSTQFWSLVGRCCSNHKVYEKWLKKNRAIVELI